VGIVSNRGAKEERRSAFSGEPASELLVDGYCESNSGKGGNQESAGQSGATKSTPTHDTDGTDFTDYTDDAFLQLSLLFPLL